MADLRHLRARAAPALLGLLWLLGSSCATVAESDTIEPAANEPAIAPALQRPTGRFLKRRVAIARFSNETQYGKSVFLDQGGDNIGKQASDILSTRLAASGKFLLLERGDAARIEAEAQRAGVEPMSIHADYLIVGSVTEFGRTTTGEHGFLSKTKTQKAYAKVNLRLVDVRTGLTVHSDEGRGEAISQVGKVMGIGTSEGYDSTLDEKAISAAISKLVSNVAANLLEEPWRSPVLSAGDGNVIIGGGKEQGVVVGDRFALMKRGERLKNPQTGATIETPGTSVGAIEVTSTFGAGPDNEGAVCRLLSGTLDGLRIEELVVEEQRP